MKSDKPDKAILDAWHDAPPANWRWYFIYYNPKDKRIFPPKRNKWAGWTVNFANPYSILAFILLLVILILFMVIL